MVSILGGLGFGAIPVMNIIAVQHSVPKRYVGVATGSFYLMISVGIAMSPAILGSAMNTRYDKEIKTLLPNIERIADKATMASLMNPRVLLSPQSMTTLRELMYKGGSDRQLLFEQTVQANRSNTPVPP